MIFGLLLHPSLKEKVFLRRDPCAPLVQKVAIFYHQLYTKTERERKADHVYGVTIYLCVLKCNKMLKI